MNNKGFMMAEVIVVSAIILVTLTSIYISYNKIISIYNKRVDYYDVKTLYILGNIREKIYKSDPGAPIDEGKQSSYGYYDEEKEDVQYISYMDQNLKLDDLDGPSKSLEEYVKYLNTSVNFKSIEQLTDANAKLKGLLVMERCQNSDKTNCKYAYLEIYKREL